MKTKTVLPEFISPRQAVLWMGLGLLPQEPRLEDLDNYPKSVADVSETDGLTNEQRVKLVRAKAEFERALIQGRLQAVGEPYFPQVPIPCTEDNLLFLACVGHSGSVEIPSNWWHPRAINWELGSAHDLNKTGSGGRLTYTNVKVRTEEVRRLWRLGACTRVAPHDAGRPGRKPKYDKAEFFKILACEADVNSLPGTQAEAVLRMQEVLGHLWGEENAPGVTWLKEVVAEYFATRNNLYEPARRALEGAAS